MVMNWTCAKMGLTIKKKISYCGESFKSKCQGCPHKGEEFQADFPDHVKKRRK